MAETKKRKDAKQAKTGAKKAPVKAAPKSSSKVARTRKPKAKTKKATKPRTKKTTAAVVPTPQTEANDTNAVQAEEMPSEIQDSSEIAQQPTLESGTTEVTDQRTDEAIEPTDQSQSVAVETLEEGKVPETDTSKESKPISDPVKTVEIRITMPAFSGTINSIQNNVTAIANRLHQRITSIRRRTIIFAEIVAILIFAGMIAYHVRANHKAYEESHTVQGALGGNPTYTTVLPYGKTISQLGGWTRVSPTNKNPAYAYADRIGGIGIVVSEQPLPSSMQSDPATQISKIAQAFGTNQRVTAGNATIYVISSATSAGPQSVVSSKNNVLLLMRSASPIANLQWIAYVDSLQ